MAVLASFAFPTTLILDAPQVAGTAPGGIVGVLKNLVLNVVSNPVKALTEANFIGILAWAIGLGAALRHASPATRAMLADVAEAVSKVVRVVIRFAPLGIIGLVGATINMAGAAITIAVMSLAAAHTLGITVDLPSALLLSVVSALGACGDSGVAGGSLLLIPMACNLFGIPTDVAMQVVTIGFITGVVQDSVETALNSSTDVLFTAAACGAAQARQG